MTWTIPKLKQRIEQCESIIERTDAILNQPFQAMGAFTTGRSNRPKSLDRMVDSENNRRSKAFRQNQQARKDLAFYRARLAGIESGEVHPNGQPRKDAPSRQRRKTGEAQLAEFMRAFIKKGDTVAVFMNPENTLTVKRVNKKSITAESGSIWEWHEIIPMRDGKAMETVEVIRAYKEWVANAEKHD